MAKKNFKNPALQFISGEDSGAKETDIENTPETQAATATGSEEARTETAPEAEGAKATRGRKPKAPALQAVPEGFRVDHRFVEVKSRRVQLVFQQTLYDSVKALADRKNLSFNECVHQLLNMALKHVKE